jgi:transglutaminase-like putative cysteine protease
MTSKTYKIAASAHRAVLLIACLYSTSFVATADDTSLSFPEFSIEAPLYGRYPDLVQRAAYKTWRTENEIGAWHETKCVDDHRQVIIQAAAQADRLFVAEIQQCASALRSKVQRAEALDVSETSESKEVAIKAFSDDQPPDSGTLRAVQPVVSFGGPKAKVSWEFDFTTPKERLRLLFRDGKKIKTTTAPTNPASTPVESAALDLLEAPDLASNELHHNERFREKALEWTKGATTIRDKARRIYFGVKANYTYNTGSDGIKEFTWSDLLARDDNGHAGVCDEWAVVQISYLRSLGIPARMILLKWKRGPIPEAHAALEFQDEQLQWHHMDALYAFDEPSVYHKHYDARKVEVWLATNPDDSRSTVDAKGKPDQTGDGKLNPFGDFELKRLYKDIHIAEGYDPPEEDTH